MHVQRLLQPAEHRLYTIDQFAAIRERAVGIEHEMRQFTCRPAPKPVITILRRSALIKILSSPGLLISTRCGWSTCVIKLDRNDLKHPGGGSHQVRRLGPSRNGTP
jgi:hypothetical protein